MAYSPEIAAVGGIAHIPIIIMIFKTIEKRFHRKTSNIDAQV